MMATMKLALDWIFSLIPSRMSSAVSNTIHEHTISANRILTGKLPGAEIGC
jgi:hypothetical protein